MAFRTYVPTLRVVLYTAYRFGTRYNRQLAGTLGAAQMACLTSTLQAIADCLALLGPAPIND